MIVPKLFNIYPKYLFIIKSLLIQLHAPLLIRHMLELREYRCKKMTDLFITTLKEIIFVEIEKKILIGNVYIVS